MKTCLVAALVLLFSLPALADDSKADRIFDRIERSLVELEQLTQKALENFSSGCNEALDKLETKLKAAREKADKKSNHALDKIEQKLKALGKKLDAFQNEKKADPEKAREINKELKKVDSELDAQTKPKGETT